MNCYSTSDSRNVLWPTHTAIKRDVARKYVIIFGGEPYTEPVVVAGTFVMNMQHEISLAYNDYYKGKYGEIVYQHV